MILTAQLGGSGKKLQHGSGCVVRTGYDSTPLSHLMASSGVHARGGGSQKYLTSAGSSLSLSFSRLLSLPLHYATDPFTRILSSAALFPGERSFSVSQSALHSTSPQARGLSPQRCHWIISSSQYLLRLIFFFLSFFFLSAFH